MKLWYGESLAQRRGEGMDVAGIETSVRAQETTIVGIAAGYTEGREVAHSLSGLRGQLSDEGRWAVGFFSATRRQVAGWINNDGTPENVAVTWHSFQVRSTGKS